MLPRMLVVAVLCFLGTDIGQAKEAAAINDGNAMLANCAAMERIVEQRKTDDMFGAGYCIGILHGVRSAMRVANALVPIKDVTCVPESISNGQAMRVVVKWLKDNPTVLDYDAGQLAYLALQESYPCK